MNLDDSFPLDMVSSRVRTAVLREFQGRCPSIREMTQIPDKHWLATPGIGSSALMAIRSVADDPPSNPVASPSLKIGDAALIERLEFLENELQHICAVLKSRVVSLV